MAPNSLCSFVLVMGLLGYRESRKSLEFQVVPRDIHMIERDDSSAQDRDIVSNDHCNRALKSVPQDF